MGTDPRSPTDGQSMTITAVAMAAGSQAAGVGERPPVAWSATLTVPIRTCLARVPSVHLPAPVPAAVLQLTLERCVQHHRDWCGFCRFARFAARVFFSPAPLIALMTLSVLGPRLFLPVDPDGVAGLTVTVATVCTLGAAVLLCLHLAARVHLRRVASSELPVEVVYLITMVTSPGTVAFDPRSQPPALRTSMVPSLKAGGWP